MKNKMKDIRVDILSIKAKVSQLSEECSIITLKYTKDEISYVKYKEQLNKNLKEREVNLKALNDLIDTLASMEHILDGNSSTSNTNKRVI